MPGLPNPWVIVGVIVAFLAFGTAAYFKGRHDMDLVYKADALKAEKQVVADVVQQDQVTQAVAEKAEEKQAEIRYVTQTVIKKVPIYVTQKSDAACPVPLGFVRLHDAAARGTALSESPGEPNDGPSDVKLSEAGRTVVENYGTCLATRQTLIALQDWVRQQQTLWAHP